MMHILKIQRIGGYSQEGGAGVLMDSEHFNQWGRLLICSVGPQPLTVNSSIFFSLNISAVPYDFFLKTQHDKMCGC